MKMMNDKITDEFALVAEITMVAGQFGVAVSRPFLSSRFIEFAKTIPLDRKNQGV